MNVWTQLSDWMSLHGSAVPDVECVRWKYATGFNPAQKVTNPEPTEVFPAAPKTDSQYPSAADIGMNIRTAPRLSAHRLSLLIIL